MPTFAERLYPLLKASGRNVVYSPAGLRAALSTAPTTTSVRRVLGKASVAVPSPVRMVSSLGSQAISLKARWENRFTAERTRFAPFFLPNGRIKQVLTMHQSEFFELATFAEGQLLRLRYAGCDLALLILLPITHSGLAALEKRYAEGALPSWLIQLSWQAVDVSLPRIVVRDSIEFAEPLRAFGVTVASLVQQCALKIDEAGTEAATPAQPVEPSDEETAIDDPPVAVAVQVNRPFVFLIHDRKTKASIFAGRVLDPTAAPE